MYTHPDRYVYTENSSKNRCGGPVVAARGQPTVSDYELDHLDLDMFVSDFRFALYLVFW